MSILSHQGPPLQQCLSPGKFTKEGVTTERNKGRNGSTKAFLRMNTSKMKNKPTKFTRRALSRKKKSKTPPKPTARRNDAHHADSTSSRCKAQLVFILHEASGDIYLGSKASSLQHCNHLSESSTTTNCNEGDLDNADLNLLKVLYEKGVTSSSLAEVFNQMRHDSGKKGDFCQKPSTTLRRSITPSWIWPSA